MITIIFLFLYGAYHATPCALQLLNIMSRFCFTYIHTQSHVHCDHISASAMIINTHTSTQSHRKAAEIQIRRTPHVRREQAISELGDQRLN